MLADKNSQTHSDIQASQIKRHLKFFDSFFAAAMVIVVISYLTDFLPTEFNNHVFASPFLMYVFYGNAFWVFGLLFATGYSIYWHRKEKLSSSFQTLKKQALLRTILRYGLCFIIAGYGFTKLLVDTILSWYKLAGYAGIRT